MFPPEKVYTDGSGFRLPFEAKWELKKILSAIGTGNVRNRAVMIGQAMRNIMKSTDN